MNNDVFLNNNLIQKSFSGDSNQQFKISKLTGDSEYVIYPMNTIDRNSTKTLGIEDNATLNLKKVLLASRIVSGSSQKFKISTSGLGDNSYKILTGITEFNKCITVRNASYNDSAEIIQYSYRNDGNTDNDHWYFEKANLLPDSGTFYIKNQRSGKYLDVRGANMAENTQMIQYTYNGKPNQQFKIQFYTNSSAEYYTVAPVISSDETSNLVLQIKDSSLNNEAQIELGNNTSSLNQKFHIVPTGLGDGSYKILSVLTDESKCLTVYQASGDDSANIIQYTYNNNGNTDNDHWYFEDISLLNKKIFLDLPDSQHGVVYHFTVPDNKLYTVETLAYNAIEIDTYMSISFSPMDRLMVDDNSGEGNNAKITFKNMGGIKISIFIRMNDNSTYRKCWLQIRKQQAVLYAFDYGSGDIDTTSDLNTPYNCLSDLYDTYLFTNKNRDHILATDSRHLQRINSEIVFFSGHGYSNVSGVRFYTEFNGLHSNEIPNLHETKIVIWSACYSASSEHGTSMIDESVSQGAQAAFGFEKSVDELLCRNFTNGIFEALEEGMSFGDAVSDSYRQFSMPWIAGINSYRIAGSAETKITTTSTFTGYLGRNASLAYNIPQEINLSVSDAFSDFKNTCQYILYEDRDNIKRYYKMINGYISNEYFLTQNINGIEKIYDYTNTSENTKIFSINTDILNNLKLENNINQSDIFYALIGDIYLPIVKIEKDISGLNIKFIDLTNGEYIDDSLIIGGFKK